MNEGLDLKSTMKKRVEAQARMEMLHTQIAAQLLGHLLTVDYARAVQVAVQKADPLSTGDIEREEYLKHLKVDCAQSIRVASTATDGLMAFLGLIVPKEASPPAEDRAAEPG